MSDALDIYGKTKYLGEVISDNSLTLRTSIIGRELDKFTSLLEWFISQDNNKVKGYSRAIYSGTTTNHLSEIVAQIIEKDQQLCGLYQIASNPISKYNLLELIRDHYNLNVEIEKCDKFVCDRSLNGEKFNKKFKYVCKNWAELIYKIKNEKNSYYRFQT